MASKASVVVLISSTGEIAASGWGSSGTATRKLHGITDQSFSILQTLEAPPVVGYYGAGPIVDRVQESGEFSLEGIWTYEEAPKYLNGFFTHTSASTGAVGAPYGFFWAAPNASTQANATYPIEFGPSSSQAYIARGCLFNSLRISGESPGYWNFSIDGFAKSIVTATGLTTAAQADARTMTPVKMQDTRFRVDDFSSGTVASSSGEVSATLISFELNYDPKRHVKFFAGSANPGAWGDDRNEATLRTLLEFNATAKGYVDELIGSSTSTGSTGAIVERLVSIYATQTSSSYLSVINFAGVIDSPVQMWPDRDGNLTLDVTWRGKYSSQFSQNTTNGSSGAGYLGFQITNQSSSTT